MLITQENFSMIIGGGQRFIDLLHTYLLKQNTLSQNRYDTQGVLSLFSMYDVCLFPLCQKEV